ncbi:MAG TPA: hypothetical protein VEB43_15700 [Anaeromyxobacter sp.]|nr:hypothetical protein [Anaeromyxobacter sp.]
MFRIIRTSVVAIALSGPVAATAEEKQHQVDIARDVADRGITRIQERVGSVLFQQVLLQNVPTEAELRNADEDDKARPRFALVLGHTGTVWSKLDLKLQLEDEAKGVLFSCSVSKVQGPAWNDVVGDACKGRWMYMREWPKVRTVRLVGTITD